MRSMLKIENLTATVGDEDDAKTIINGLSLEVPKGEVHAIMGPNGAGKSTLSYVLTGRSGYEVTGGSVTLNGEDILSMEPEERAAKGMFLSFHDLLGLFSLAHGGGQVLNLQHGADVGPTGPQGKPLGQEWGVQKSYFACQF